MLDPYCDLSVMQTCETVGHKNADTSEDSELFTTVTDSLYSTIGIRLSNVRVNHCKQVEYLYFALWLMWFSPMLCALRVGRVGLWFIQVILALAALWSNSLQTQPF